jgi:hypothetical protein
VLRREFGLKIGKKMGNSENYITVNLIIHIIHLGLLVTSGLEEDKNCILKE